ncbi:uncharacterized protein ARMOST_09254 [Armillaria ostoyae]|uniref:peptidyl-tRNA hydrolase n=1 Tax=Armillaria ostoyae TaxID=47428 RepID=A0A284RAX8_ARMOS|nr:uncharacterized protein ARMOST_09254 [Armillaria ostoyae]
MHTLASGPAYGAVVAATFVIGLWVGSNVLPRDPAKSEKPHGRPVEAAAKGTEATDPLRDIGEDDESDSEAEDEDNGDLSSLKIDPTEECTMVLVVREDLGMTSGKIAAQCSHAVLACYQSMLSSNVPTLGTLRTTQIDASVFERGLTSGAADSSSKPESVHESDQRRVAEEHKLRPVPEQFSALLDPLIL